MPNSAGNSKVRCLRKRPATYTLVLGSSTSWLARLDVPCDADREAIERLREAGLHPLAVRLVFDVAEGFTCTGLFISATGPERHVISLGTALTLCGDGIHTVVTRW